MDSKNTVVNSMSFDDRLALITKGCSEIHGIEDLKRILKMRSPVAYFGIAPTERIHIGYLIPILKMADLLKAECDVKILFADVHSMLDNPKNTCEQIKDRCEYYEKIIKSILNALKVPLDKLQFIKGSSFQLTEKYTMDSYKLSSLMTMEDYKKAGFASSKLSEMIYPIHQVLDEEYLGADIRLGELNQTKLMTMARRILPSLKYKKRIYLLTPAISNLILSTPTNLYKKITAHHVNYKIDFLDTAKDIKAKINKAYSPGGILQENPLLDLVECIVFPLLENEKFVINRQVEYGGVMFFDSVESVKSSFLNFELCESDLKLGVFQIISRFCQKIAANFQDPESFKLMRRAYPC